MDERAQSRALRLAEELLFLAAALCAPVEAFGQNSLCAVVKLEIQQQATLEREGFDAHLTVNNGLPDQPMTNFKVQISFKDANGNPADSLFFVKIGTLTGTNAIDGTGVIQSSGTADIHWLIIPSSGTGGVNPAGQRYGVSALITGVSNGAPQSVQTFDAFITVHPQPLIKLEYVLPYEVFADEPLTPQIEPIEPFPLGVRVTNVGYGTANNFQINSAQPQIIENKQGLAVDFKLLGTVLSGQQVPNTLLIPFGNLPPQSAALGEWTMSTTLSGRFISFTSTFTHAADLGGQLTSLMQSVTTYTLLKDVLVDLPGRDQVPDFLVNASMDRGAMQAVLDGGAQPPAELILESDQPTPLTVAEVPGALAGTLAGGSASLTYSFTQGVGSNVWVHSTAPWPYGKQARLAGARRSDGKLINPANVWISKHFRKADLTTIYWINVLDLSSAGASYALQFSSSGFDLPPGAVTDLAAASGASGGSVSLTWSSPGEDGYAGNLFGARTMIQAATTSSAAFSPASAQISFATAAVQGALQSYLASGLIGNATQYVYLWTQDGGGNLSPISNGATVYALAYPPSGLAFAEVDASSITVGWQLGNNALPIAYSVRLSSVAGGPMISSSPFQDSFSRTFTFTGLAPGGTYYFYGVAQNPATGVSSPVSLMGSTRTSSGLQDVLPPRTNLTFGAPSYSGAWLYVSSVTPLGLAAVDDQAAVGDGKGQVARSYYAIDLASFTAYSGTFTVVAQGTHTVRFYSVDLVGNAEVARSTQVAVDLTAPAAQLSVLGSSAAAGGTLFVAAASSLAVTAQDPVVSGAASGVAGIQLSVDAATAAYAAPFTLAPGTHTVGYGAFDRLGNGLGLLSTRAVASDGLPPRTTLSFSSPAYQGMLLYLSSSSVLSLYSSDDLAAVGDSRGAGVARTLLAVDTATFAPAASTFTLSEGLHALSWYSADLVGNAEAARSTQAAVDATPPETFLQLSGGRQFQAGTTLYASSATRFGFSAIDPAVSSVSAGVALTRYAVDASSFQVYASTFALVEGTHTLTFQSQDNVANLEVPRSSAVVVDATPPVSTATVAAPSFLAADGTLYIATTTPVSLSAYDPGAGSGVGRVEFAVDGGSFAVYASSLTLAEGRHAVAYRAIDNVGNVEATHVLALSVDATPPLTTLAVSTPSFGAFVSSAAAFSLSAVDPVVSSVSAGVALSRYRVNGGAFSASTAPFSLSGPDGAYLVEYQSVDRVSNMEALRSASARLDQTPPVTSLALLGGRQFPGPDVASFYASSDTRLLLISTDAGSGVAATMLADNSSALAPSTAPFALSEGAHGLAYQSRDNVGNLEVLRSTTVLVDATPPVTAVSVGTPTFTAADGTVYVSPASPIAFSAADPALPGGRPGSGVAHVEASVDGAAFVAVSSAIFLAEGRHVIEYRSIDNVGNVEAARTLALRSDATPPVTSLALSGPSFGAFVSTSTAFALSAVDPVVSSVSAGVALTRYRINGGAFSASTAPFALSGPDGSYLVEYQSLDNVSNPEVLRSTTVLLDATPPVTTAAVGVPSYAAPDGALYVSPATPVTLAAVDPSSGAAASGVVRLEFSLDGAAFTAYAGALTFAEGRHALLYRAIDRVGNVEAAKSLSLQSDATPPVTALAPSGALFASGGRSYAPATFSYGFTAADPVAGGVASGVAFTRYAVDASSFQVFVSSFALSEGARLVSFQSQDRVGNLELPKAATVYVDATPPVTTLSFNGPTASAGGTLFVGKTATLSFSAVDPVSNGVASGVGLTSVAVGSAPFVAAQASMTLTGADGPRLISWFSTDNAGNAEAVKTASATLDATPPAIAVQSPQGGQTYFARGAVLPIRFTALDNYDAAPSSSAVLVELVDEGTPRGGRPSVIPVHSGQTIDPATLDDGVWQLQASATDFVLNAATAASGPFRVVLDVLPPRTTLALSTPALPGAPAFVGAGSLASLAAVDDLDTLGDGLGLGVAVTSFSLDGGALSRYAGPFSLGAEGPHAVSYLSVDVLGHAEAVNVSSVVVDLTPPALSFAAPPAWFATRAPVLTLSYADAASGVDPSSLRVVVDGRDVTAMASAGPAAATVSLSGLADGSHSASATLADRVGNVASANVSLRVDATPPTVTISSPAAGAFLNVSTPTLSAAFTDALSGVSTPTLSLSLDGRAVPAVPVQSGGGVSVGAWQPAPAPPVPLVAQQMATDGRYAYMLGGGPSTGGLTNQVLYSVISPQGTLGPWQATTPLPQPVFRFASAMANGFIYTLGGELFNPSFNVSAAVNYAAVGAGGILGPWQAGPDLPVGVFGLTRAVTVVSGPYLYAIGGSDNGSSIPTNRVYVSKLGADGRPGPWSPTASLPVPLGEPRAVQFQGRIYVLGGERFVGNGNQPQSTVYVAQTNPDGSIPAWTRAADLPEPLSAGAAAVDASGRLIYAGGTSGVTLAASANVYATQIQPDGSLAPWSATTPLPAPASQLAAAAFGGSLYTSGGAGAAGYAASQSAALSSPPPTATLTAAPATAEGAHALLAQGRDAAGNLGSARVSYAVDLTPPQSALAVSGGSKTAPGILYVRGQVPIVLASTDPVSGGVASGVKDSWLSLNGTPFTLSTAAFTLADSSYTASFYSRDNAGNVEAAKTLSLVVDGVPPAAVTDLYGSNPTTTTLTLAWTSPGDNGSSGAILGGRLLIERSTTPAAADPAAAQLVLPLANEPANAPQRLTLTGLGTGTTYFLTVWTEDTAGNLSLASNQAVAQTLAVAVSADGKATLVSQDAAIAISTVAQAATQSFTIAASSQGLQLLTSSYYDLGGVHVAFSTPAVLSFLFNPAGVDLSRVAIWRFDGVQWTSAPVAGQTITLLAGGLAQISGTLMGTSLYGVFEIIDIRPPRTTLSFGAPVYRAGDGTAYLTRQTVLTLTSVDDLVSVGDSVGLGVASLSLSVDGASRLSAVNPAAGRGRVFGSTLTLADADGPHALSWRGVDVVGNAEAAQTARVALDDAPPATTANVGSPKFAAADGTIYVATTTPVTLAALDPALAAGQPGSGVNHIEVAVDSAPFGTYTTPLTFAEGRHTVLYRAIDNVGNVEATRTLSLQSDATPPLTSLAVQGGRQFPGPDPVSFFASSDTRFAFPATDPIVNNVASGLAFTRWSDDSGAWQTFTAPIILAEGVHRLAYQSQDNVLNLEVVRSTTALIDATPPMTELAIVGGRQFAGPSAGTFYASSDTRLALPAADPPVNGVASGLSSTRWQDNGGAFQNFAGPFGLGEGAHALSYQSQDNVANLEVLRSTNAWVDATPPVTAFAFGKPSFQAADGANYVTPATPLSFSAADPNLPSGQPGSGVNHIELAVDGAPFATYTTALTFAEGRHTILYRSIDNVGNVEATKALSLQSDATPPVTALALQGGHQFPGPDAVSFFASADTRFAFPAADPIVNNVASGVAFTRWGDNSGAWQTFTSPIALAEGVHHLAYQSQDNVQNLEVVRSTTVLIDATAPLTQLAVVGGRQFAGPNAGTFYASSDTRLALPAIDPVVNGVASGLAFTRWQDNNGAFQASAAAISLAEGAHVFAYQSQDHVANLEVLRTTNVWVDATPPASTFAFGLPYYQAADGTNYVTPATPLSFAAADPNLPTGQAGSGVSRIEVAVDGAPFAPYAAPLTFAEGRHTLLYRAIDKVGNVEAAHALALQSDATPPISSLLIGQPQYQLPNVLLVSSRTPFSIPAVDPVVSNVASGVKDTFYRVSDVSPSTAPFGAFSAPFSMSGLDVTKVVEFYSRDHVLNTEVVKSSAVLLDATPPEVSLLSPAGCDSGICRVLKGKFPVLGTARDLHFASYVLDAASGQGASSGFVQISSGAVAVSSGTLGVWDATKLAGWQTLRLTATDLVQNVSVLTLNVWVGDPAALMVLGNHDTFNMPTGVAVSSSGAIYVADREADRVQVFSSTGGLMATFGGHPHDSDDHAVSTSTLRLHEPAGVAVDAAGDLFIADTDDNRVLELSPSGQVLLELGRKTLKRDDDHGSSEREEGRGPGEFHEPLGVALDASGGLYVADSGNRRVQVFSSSGAFVLQFALPPLPQPQGDDGDEHDSDDGPALGKPAGIALDPAGRVYLADPPGRRALVYTSTGSLLLAIPIVSDKPGPVSRPYGVAVSPSGDCLLVSDLKGDRVLKFDFQGAQNLSFGQKAAGDDDARAPSAAIVFRKPAGLALDTAGNLYVADRNDESVKKFGLPNGQSTLVVPPPKPDDGLAARDVIDRDDGGKVARKDKASVAVPAQALSQDLKITVAPPADGAADDNSRTRAQQESQLKVASPPVEFSPEGTKFAKPATLTIPYDPRLVAEQGVSEDDLKINYWDRDKQQWEAFDSMVDKANHTVTAKTSHFSLYQVLSSTPGQVGVAGGPVADPTFTVHAVYAFPNPAVRGAKPTIHVAVGVADEVKITILNVAGQQVAHGELYGTPPVIDDGGGPQYAYEWVWDGHIASGMYFYVVEASKAGYPKIRRAGKLGVVR